MDTELEEIGEKIDWLAYSQPSAKDWCFPSYIEDNWKPISPLRHYTHGQENKQGVKRFWSITNPKQGRKVEFGGSVLPSLGENLEEFLHFISLQDVKPTRIDFCVDIIHSKTFNPKSVVSHLRSKKVITHAKQIPKYSDEWMGGFTQYIGRKTSETYTRIYDKAVEQKVPFKWARIETVYQGERAQPALQAYLLHKSAIPLIIAHVDFPQWKQWQRIMSSSKAKLRYQTRQSNTRKWLLNSVSKSIANELLLDDDQSFLFELMDRVREEYKRLSPGYEVDW